MCDTVLEQGPQVVESGISLLTLGNLAPDSALRMNPLITPVSVLSFTVAGMVRDNSKIKVM